MAFRDDELATRSRVDALKAELEEVRAENEALRRKASPKHKSSKHEPLNPWVWAIPVLGVVLALLGGWNASTDGSGPGAIILALGAMIAFTATALIFMVRSVLVVVPPGRIAVFSGLNRVAPDGQVRGFRIVRQGRAIRIPILERHDMLNTGPFRVETTLRNVYTKGNTATHVQVRAEISVAKTEPHVLNAVERFLGRDEDEIGTVGGQTLEGVARGVAAHVTIHELREDRTKIEETLMRDAEADFEKLGLTLESFHILEVREA